MPRAAEVQPIAAMIAGTMGVVPGSENLWRWGGFTGGVNGLEPLKQVSDTNIHFFRRKDHKARLEMFNIQPGEMINVKVSDPVRLKSKSKKAASVEFSNDSELEQEKTLTYTFTHSKDTMNEVKAGMSFTSTSGIEVGGEASQSKVTQEFSSTISSEFTHQTGIQDEEAKESSLTIKVPPMTVIRAWIEWNESTLQRTIRADVSYNYGIRLGKRSKRSGNGPWRWKGDKQWNSKEELANVLEGKGSVKQHLADYFYRNRSARPSQKVIDAIRAGPLQQYNQTVKYKDADDIRVNFETVRKLD